MKKVLVLFVVGVVLFGAFSAQNANAQSRTIDQRIIGSWAASDGGTWNFKSDGTGSGGVYGSYQFAVTDTQLAIVSGRNTFILDISWSSDGRTLILVAKNGPAGYFCLLKQ